MDGAIKLLGFLGDGARTNWWGIGCASHCGAPSLPTLLLTFFAGTLFGLLLALGLGFKLGLFQLPSSPPSSASSVPDRLSAYLNEPAIHSIVRRRGRG